MRLAVERQCRVFAFAGSESVVLEQHGSVGESSRIDVSGGERLDKTRVCAHRAGRVLQNLQAALLDSHLPQQVAQLQVQLSLFRRVGKGLLVLARRSLLLAGDPQGAPEITPRDRVPGIESDRITPCG